MGRVGKLGPQLDHEPKMNPTPWGGGGTNWGKPRMAAKPLGMAYGYICTYGEQGMIIDRHTCHGFKLQYKLVRCRHVLTRRPREHSGTMTMYALRPKQKAWRDGVQGLQSYVLCHVEILSERICELVAQAIVGFYPLPLSPPRFEGPVFVPPPPPPD